MIQANELRIGNWVRYDKHVLRVESIIDYPNKKVIGAESDNAGIEDDNEIFSPIPLTPEILEKCGFKKGKSKGVARFVDDIDDIDPKDKHRYTYFWDLKIPENNHVDDLYSFILVQFGKGTDILWKHQMLAVKVTSLHQLQNLFYSLTGQELIYKP